MKNNYLNTIKQNKMSTQGKTPQEWAEYLPEPIRTQFLENVNPNYGNYSERTDSLDDCIYSSFDWEYTTQGEFHWNAIYERALNGEFSKPIEKEKTLGNSKLDYKELSTKFTEKLNSVPKDEMLKFSQNQTTKMTAVEWLVEELYKEGHFKTNVSFTEINELRLKAESMEKEQMIDFANEYADNVMGGMLKRADEYYDEIFGGDK